MACGSSRYRDLPGDRPDKAGKFSSDGNADLVQMQVAGTEAPVALCETQLSAPGDLTHCLGLTFLAHLVSAADAGSEALVPSRFDKHASGMTVAGFSDRAAMARVAGGELGRHQPEEPHHVPWMGEAAEVADLCNEGHGRDEVDAAQSGQCCNYAPQAPAFAFVAKRLGNAIESILGLAHGMPIFGKSNVLRRVIEADVREGTLVRCRPEGPTGVSMAVAQQQGLELLTCFLPCTQRILPGT